MKRAFLLLPLAVALPFATQAQTLQEAMRSALEVHPEIRAGVNARLAAEEELRAAKGGYMPRVDLVGGYGREGTDNPSGRASGDHGTHEAGTPLLGRLDEIFGRLRLQLPGMHEHARDTRQGR